MTAVRNGIEVPTISLCWGEGQPSGMDVLLVLLWPADQGMCIRGDVPCFACGVAWTPDDGQIRVMTGIKQKAE